MTLFNVTLRHLELQRGDAHGISVLCLIVTVAEMGQPTNKRNQFFYEQYLGKKKST